MNLLQVDWWHWVAFAVLVVALLTLDLLVFHRRIHTPTLRESAWWSVFWIGLALVFNAVVWVWGWFTHGDSKAGTDFLAAFLVEKSLSVDNLFVFAVIFRFFRVELKYQYRVLFWGILGAVILRLIFILAGVGLIGSFDWVLVVFGVILVLSGIKLAMPHSGEYHPEKNWLLLTARRYLRVSRQDHGERFFARENGRLCITPLFLVLLVVESTDVMFAVDSVPAVLGITLDPFIVFTSNVFAILGLRALYFLLAGVMDRFRYLHYGLSAVLGFIGLKMIAEYGVQRWGYLSDFFPNVGIVQAIGDFIDRQWSGHKDVHLFPSWVSLLIIATLLTVSIVASVTAKRREERRAVDAGTMMNEE